MRWRLKPGWILLVLGLPGLPAPVRPADVPSGRLEGQVQLHRELTARHVRFEPYQPAGGAAAAGSTPAGSPAGSEYGNVVIYLEAAEPAGLQTASRRHEVAQEGERFVPEVLPIVAGDQVAFPNRDPFYHNVFSLSRAKPFDLGRYPTDDSRVVVFDTPGVVKVFCHIHADMSAVILVLDSPLYTVPGEDGRFVLGGIPPGEYTAVAWHQRARRLEKHIRIRAGETLRVDFSIPMVEESDAR